MRDEFEAGANAIVLLIHNGVIVPTRYTDHQLAIYTGIPKAYIARAREQLEREGPEALRPRNPTPAAPATGGPGERGRRPRGERPDEDDRDLAVRIAKAKPLRQLAAYFEARHGDDCVDEECEACGRPIRPGDRVRIVGCVYHEECP